MAMDPDRPGDCAHAVAEGLCYAIRLTVTIGELSRDYKVLCVDWDAEHMSALA